MSLRTVEKLKGLRNPYNSYRDGSDRDIKSENIRGYDMFPLLYHSCGIFASTGSGKTNTIMNILKKKIDKRTKVIFIVPTFHQDNQYKAIKAWMKKKGIDFEVFDSIQTVGMLTEALQEEFGDDSDSDSVVDEADYETQLAEYKKKLAKHLEHQYRSTSAIYPHPGTMPEKPRPKKAKKGKSLGRRKLSPDYMIIIDDLTEKARHPELNTLLKRNRHYKASVILSSQDVKDIMPSSIGNCLFYLLFPKLPEDRLKHIYKAARLMKSTPDGHYETLTWDDFLTLYRYATKFRYNFLYIDTLNCKFRRNFDEVIEIC